MTDNVAMGTKQNLSCAAMPAALAGHARFWFLSPVVVLRWRHRDTARPCLGRFNACMSSLAVAALALGLSACATNRVDLPAFTSGTQSNLSRKNFRVVETNAQGTSYGFALFGIIPIFSPSTSSAMHDLHQQVRTEGKAVALVNIAQDRSTTYLILFSVPKVTVSADAIEFLDEPIRPARAPAID